jgi:beta-galactosidase
MLATTPTPFLLTLRVAFVGLVALTASLSAQSVDVVAPVEPASTQILDGDWHFTYVPSLNAGSLENFREPEFDVSSWKTIPVPSHWELQGFAEPHYFRPPEGLGLYRRTFQTPADWSGQRVFLRFEGVLYGFECWLNGRHLGAWASGYNPCTFDVTDALIAGDNTLAVRVSTRPKGWEFDTNDCWGLSGIYRDVKLFAVPFTHLRDVTVQTSVSAPDSADVHIFAAIDGAASNPRATARLLDPSNTPVAEATFTLAPDHSGSASLHVSNPALWTAETPTLYTLELTLRDGDRVLQTHRQRIGLREIAIVDGVLQLNGRPLKLRGVDRHDIFPDVGRAATPALLRRDLDLIRRANINFIRTSHYPSDERLLDLCDELGVYVMCEVPFGFGEEHLNDASYQDILLTRARATLQRDKNHPSVIIWSIGNENPITPIGLETGKFVKAHDPTRPICFPQIGSYFDQHWRELPDFVDIYAPHYPTVARLRHYAETLTRPTIITEYAHGLGLATDRIQEQWSIIESSPHLAGGALWHFADQGITRISSTPVDPNAPTTDVWLTSRTHYDTDGNHGADGLVYSDRTPQTDYWETRKTYAPVRILPLTSKSPNTLTIQNHFTFRSLAGLRLVWLLRRERELVASNAIALSAPAQSDEAVALPLPPLSPSDALWTLEARIIASDGTPLTEQTFRLTDGRLDFNASSAPLHTTRDASGWTITHRDFRIRVSATTGGISLVDSAGTPLVLAAGPHTSRRFTMAESLRKSPPWPDALMPVAVLQSIDVASDSTATRVTLVATYARSDAPAQQLRGRTTWTLFPDGRIAITYRFDLLNASGELLEAGYALRAAPALTDFRWTGDGPYAAYPGKNRLDEFGTYHLRRDDLYFTGNRPHVDHALLTRADGLGLALAGDAMNVAVEPHADSVLLSHNALVSGLGNKGIGPEHAIDAAKLKSIEGAFELRVLTPSWPPALLARYGAPTDRAAVFHPFYHSYDQ